MKSGIKITQHRDFLGAAGSCTIYRRPCGHWYASFIVKGYEIPDKPEHVDYEKVVGLDLGIKNFVMTSDGEIYKNEKYLKKELRKLKRAQKRLSRKKKGSNNRNKQRIRVARIHEKVKNSRNNYVNQTASSIAKNWDLICIENLDVKAMAQHKYVSDLIPDVGLGMFVNALKWQAEKRGKHLIQIGRYDPSTKTCSNCGHIQDMPLGVETYDCGNCDLVMDRDLNAALNIRAMGLNKIEGIGCQSPNDRVGTTQINASGDMSRSLDHSAQEAARAEARR